MTKGHELKTAIRERMTKTGESFTAARAQILKTKAVPQTSTPFLGDLELIHEVLDAFLRIDPFQRGDFFRFLGEAARQKAGAEGWLAPSPTSGGAYTIDQLRNLDAWPATWEVGSNRLSVLARRKVRREDLVLAQEILDLFSTVLPGKRGEFTEYWKHLVDQNDQVEEWEGPPPPPRQRPSWGGGRERWVRRFHEWVGRREAADGKPLSEFKALGEIEKVTKTSIFRLEVIVARAEWDVSRPADRFLWTTARLFGCDPCEFFPDPKG